MRWGAFIGGLMGRQCAVALAIVPVVCGLALVLASFSIAVGATPAAYRHGDVASRTVVVAQTDRSAHQHPCKRGTTSAPTASCSASGFAAGLSVAVVEHVPPEETGAGLAVARADLAPQWRGCPPDRPPRS
jgi:hypothetical protein